MSEGGNLTTMRVKHCKRKNQIPIKKPLSEHEIFDLAIADKQWGVRIDKKYSHKNLQDFKECHKIFLKGYSAKSKPLLKPFPSIIYDYINNLSFNAHAFKYKEYYIIGIHGADFIILNDLFNRMLAHNDIFPKIGNPAKESSDTSIKDYYDNVFDILNNSHQGIFKSKFPKDSKRKLYAYHITGRAMDFVFEHELAHILFGHVDYLYDRYGIHCVSEYQPSEIVNQNQFDLQTFEMNADTMALLSCCSRALNTVNNNSLVHPPFRTFYKNYYQALSDIAFAIYNTIRVFGDGDYKNIQLGKSTHPDPRVRQLQIFSTFRTMVKAWKQYFTLDYDKLHSLLIEKIKESERAYQLITGKQTNVEVFKAKYFVNNPFGMAFTDNWKKNIRNSLLKYTYVSLPS